MKTERIVLAGCVIQNSDGAIFLMHRNKGDRQHWEIPGGKVEDGEDIQATAIRELKEEAGVDVQIVRLLGQKEFKERDRILHYSWYLAKIQSGKVSIGEPEVFDDVRYFSLDNMRGQTLSEGAKTFLGLVDSGEVKL